VIKQRELVFVDTGAFIALAITSDPYHHRAVACFEELQSANAQLLTSLHIRIETFTFLQRQVSLLVAETWLLAAEKLKNLRSIDATTADIAAAKGYFAKGLHKLSLADALSFVVMKKAKCRRAFSFDHHFSSVGFHLVG
jgi:uncharacterized protein